MNQKLFEFLSDNGFTPMMSEYEEIRHLMSLEHCTPNERAFLDELREKFVYDLESSRMLIGRYSVLWEEDFTKCNIKELVNE